jgi:Fur family zinc uptake transcriptional regulator
MGTPLAPGPAGCYIERMRMGHRHGRHGHDHLEHDETQVFASPGHDHASCSLAALTRAERICSERRTRLTPIRRQVLSALAATHSPIGAYELIEKLEDHEGHRPAPITVYRALDFLLEQGLAHRIESRNAFVACAHDHGGRGVVMFLICETCGAVGEAVSDAVGAALARAAGGVGFHPRGQVIEIAGECAHCRVSREATRA